MFIEGMIVPYAGSLEDARLRDRLRDLGWLMCDGALVERSKYPRLFSALGTVHGDGDGTTTFGLPDLRGLFLRGLDDGRGLDPNRRLGTRQDDAVQPHTHKFGNRNANQPGTNHAVWFATNNPDPSIGRFDTEANDGPETRPKNLAVHYLIRADVDIF